METTYKQSGSASPVSLLLFAVVLIVLPFLAWLYIAIQGIMPLIYFNVLITVGLGFAVGYLVSFVVIKLGRVRSTPVAVAYAAVAGIIVLWLQWAIWIVSLYVDIELTFDNMIGSVNEKKKIEFEKRPIVNLYRINTKMKDAILS